MTQKEEKNNDVMKNILDEAEILFATKGYKGMKMMELAKNVNVNHAMIHYYFSSKQNLYEEIVKKLFSAWEEDIKSVVWSEENPEETMRQYIKSFLDFHVKYKNFFIIRKWDAMEDLGVFERYIGMYWVKDLEEKIATIDKWKTQGYIRNEVNSRVLMFNIWGLLDYYFDRDPKQLKEILGDKITLDDLSESIIEHILNGIIK